MIEDIKHVVCYSGGHSSALVAIEVARKFGNSNVVLLNHDIHFSVEHPDIKRFKKEVADYLELPITFANHEDAQYDQFDVCVKAKAFKVGKGTELCTSRLKTEPFMRWLKENIPDKNCIIYYGFDANEKHRIQRRSGILGGLGYKSDYPLALWGNRTITSSEEINIARPNTYSVFNHGNCIGCLKAGWQHWYIVYCTRKDVWEKAKWAEAEIGYSIHHDKSGQVYLEDMEERFSEMLAAGVEPTEKLHNQTFWAQARRLVNIVQIEDEIPCECIL